MNQSTPGFPPVVSEQVHVVYEQKTGRIIHVHSVSTLRGGEAPSEKDVHARALEHAAVLHETEKRESMKVISVDPKDFRHGDSFKIDPKKLRLVALPRTKTGL
jgi:hypothetical protein